MDYSGFFEADVQLKLRMVQLMIQVEYPRIRITQATDKLGLSRYKLNKLLTELSADLISIGKLERPIEVSAKEIENPQFDISTFQILQLWYLKQSLKYQIFEYEYLNSHQSTRKHFWKTHYSSQARYYVLRTEIDELLAEDVGTLNRSNSIQLQPELVMRISLTNIYYHFFGGVAEPFPELNQVTSRFLSFLMMTLGLSLTPSEQLKLRIFFQIQIKRIQDRQKLNLRQLIKLENSDEIQLVKNYYAKHVSLIEEADLDSEVGYLFLFLRSQDLMTSMPIKITPVILQQFDRASSAFKSILVKTPLLRESELSAHELERLANKLSEVSHWLLFVDFDSAQSLDHLDVSKLTANFPGQVQLAEQLTTKAIDIFNLKPNSVIQDELKRSYLQVLIDEVHASVLQYSVTICIDFVQSKVPLTYFSNLIAFYLGGGIKFTSQLSQNVDVYLSDTFVASIHGIPQIIWPEPLEVSNWEKLREVIAMVKQQKVQHVEATA